MIEVDKIVKSVLAFVNFFAARILLTSLLILVIRLLTGQYYFDLLMNYASSTKFSASDVTTAVAKAGEFLDVKNVQNALFVAVLIVGLSLLDVVFRIYWTAGRWLPIGMIYDSTYSVMQLRQQIAEAWRFYHKKFDFFPFQALVEEKASELRRRQYTLRGWWRDLFDFLKSSIVLVLLIVAFTPHDHVVVSGWLIASYCVVALIGIAMCTAIESARYANDVGITLRNACLTLISEAETEPLTEIELKDELAKITTPNCRLQWRSRFLCVRATITIPYLGPIEQLFQMYRRWAVNRGMQERFNA